MSGTSSRKYRNEEINTAERYKDARLTAILLTIQRINDLSPTSLCIRKSLNMNQIRRVLGQRFHKDATLPVRLHGNEPRKGAKIDQRLREEDEEELRRS